MIGRIGYENAKLLYSIGIDLFWTDTVDYAIDRIRKKYNVFIGVTPTTHNLRVCYNANIRYALSKHMALCYIPTDIHWNPNIYEVKRRAIRAAAQWILAHKCKKVSIKSRKNERSKKAKD